MQEKDTEEKEPERKLLCVSLLCSTRYGVCDCARYDSTSRFIADETPTARTSEIDVFLSPNEFFQSAFTSELLGMQKETFDVDDIHPMPSDESLV